MNTCIHTQKESYSLVRLASPLKGVRAPSVVRPVQPAISLRICVCMRMYVCVCVCVCVCMYVLTHDEAKHRSDRHFAASMCAYAYAYIDTYTQIQLYIWNIYTYVHTHTYMCTLTAP